VLALTVGWPLVSGAVADRRPVASGTVLAIGPDRASSARFQVGGGWSLAPSGSNPAKSYVLHRGRLQLSVTYVALAGAAQASRLWRGLQQLVRVSHPAVRLGNPQRVTTRRGRPGLTGTITVANQRARVTVLVAPSGSFAIETTALAPVADTALIRAVAQQVVRSIRFGGGSR
jgi:hypothetical protein